VRKSSRGAPSTALISSKPQKEKFQDQRELNCSGRV
jgi:hypothetical protein